MAKHLRVAVKEVDLSKSLLEAASVAEKAGNSIAAEVIRYLAQDLQRFVTVKGFIDDSLAVEEFHKLKRKRVPKWR